MDTGPDDSGMEIFADCENEFTFGATQEKDVEDLSPEGIISIDQKAGGPKEFSIVELQDDYAGKAAKLYNIKVQLTGATYLGQRILGLVIKNDLPTLEQKLGQSKLEEIKPLINQYLEQELISNEAWEKISVAFNKENKNSNPNEVSLSSTKN